MTAIQSLHVTGLCYMLSWANLLHDSAPLQFSVASPGIKSPSTHYEYSYKPKLFPFLLHCWSIPSALANPIGQLNHLLFTCHWQYRTAAAIQTKAKFTANLSNIANLIVPLHYHIIAFRPSFGKRGTFPYHNCITIILPRKHHTN